LSSEQPDNLRQTKPIPGLIGEPFDAVIDAHRSTLRDAPIGPHDSLPPVGSAGSAPAQPAPHSQTVAESVGMKSEHSRPANYSPPQSAAETLLCRLLLSFMVNSKRVHIDFGRDGGGANDPRDVDFILAAPRLAAAIRMMLAPGLKVGEGFVAGDWYLQKGNLSDFLRAGKANAKFPFKEYYLLSAKMGGIRHYLGQYILNRYFTRKVKHHYDVDSRIYEMLLDDEMVYTCGFFNNDGDGLAAAQQNKIATAIARMALPPDQARVLDIGCGWGATERALVRGHPGVEVCGLSISQGQIDWAKRKDLQSLSASEINRIEYRLEDYTDHKRSDYYDAISVIGMLEHVGLGGYDEFFAAAYKFLKPGGRALIHTIVSPTPATPTNKWIEKHIFTGGYAPSLSELTRSVEPHAFHISGMYLYPPVHYRKTIDAWTENFVKNIPDAAAYLKSIGFSTEKAEAFIRTWIFYLAAVRIMFTDDAERNHQIVQMCITKL